MQLLESGEAECHMRVRKLQCGAAQGKEGQRGARGRGGGAGLVKNRESQQGGVGGGIVSLLLVLNEEFKGASTSSSIASMHLNAQLQSRVQQLVPAAVPLPVLASPSAPAPSPPLPGPRPPPSVCPPLPPPASWMAVGQEAWGQPAAQGAKINGRDKHNLPPFSMMTSTHVLSCCQSSLHRTRALR